jgi:ech hydrogenase subunit A
VLLIAYLILFPAVVAALLLGVKKTSLRSAIVTMGVLGVVVGVIALFVLNFHNGMVRFKVNSVWIDRLILLLDVGIGCFILWQAVRFKKPLVGTLAVVQVLLITGFEILYGHQIEVQNPLFVDKLSVLMALIIAIVGGLICLYAVGYMRDFHSEYHKDMKDNQRLFFFLLFIFLSAMFGIVFSNSLVWLYFFWEITTLCSFLLIGYKKTEESYNNAFLALKYNLLGGLGFVLGIIGLYLGSKTVELDKAMLLGKSWTVLLPVALICFAGLTKSAQLPFSSWLLGAMVAPTPVSALLHSSTMVKAGVYIILRFAMVLQGTNLGIVLAMIGGITFLVGSLIAISCSDAKKVLAYSTVANLGLIVLCAGVGTYEAVWAGTLLIIFHAVAKCLLFLCVGTIEHKIHSRNIEDMTALIVKMPKLSIMMQIGMAGMFLAPFGMLISKWAVLKALVDSNPLLAMFVVFGSAACLFFWVKWMGKLLIVIDPQENLEHTVHRSEWIPLVSLSALTVLLCGLFPVVSSILVEPYVVEIYGRSVTMSGGNVFIMLMMLAMVMLFPLSFLNYGKNNVKVIDAYLGGANTESHVQYRGPAGSIHQMQMGNYYLDSLFGESVLLKYSVWVCGALILLMFVIR